MNGRQTDLYITVQLNREYETKIQRSTKTVKKQPENKLVPLNTVAPSAIGTSSILTASWGPSASPPISTSLGPSSSHGPQIFLRVRVDMADAGHVSTTIPV